MAGPAAKRQRTRLETEHDSFDDELMLIAEEDVICREEGGDPFGDAQRPERANRPMDAPRDTLRGDWTPPERWGRPPVQPLDPMRKPLVVMQLDASVAPAPDREGAAVINLFGVTEVGNSVLLRVRRFFPYLYVPVTCDIKPHDLYAALNAHMRRRCRNNRSRYVVHVEVVIKRSIMHYIPGDPETQFFKVTLLNPNYIRDIADVLQRGSLSVKTARGTVELPGVVTYESNLDYLLRFMVDVRLTGCSWLTVPPGRYAVSSGERKGSLAQVEIDVKADDLIAHDPHGEWFKTAPLRRLSFDIKCAGRAGVFPEAQHDGVIQIANYLREYGHDSDKPAAKVVFTLKSCAPIDGADVISFDSEENLLSAWSRFVRKSDPDVLTGYNITTFDLPYLLDRGRALRVVDFPLLGRLHHQGTWETRTGSSSGTRRSRFSVHGRVILDVFSLINTGYKLGSYSLGSVSYEFLREQREDIPENINTELQRGDELTRRRLAMHCLTGAVLPIRLMDKLMFLTKYMEMARVTGIPLRWLREAGYMARVVSLLHRKCCEVNVVVPDVIRFGVDAGGSGSPQLDMATGIEPKTGYYREQIVALDWVFLRPSIVVAYNLCYSTLVRPEHRNFVCLENVTQTPTAAYFVKKSVKKGILPAILQELLSSSKQTARDLETTEDPLSKSMIHARQLALNSAAYAAYGLPGASAGKYTLPCMEIHASWVELSREIFQRTAEEVRKAYNGANVIYGDTRSVMIKFGTGVPWNECVRRGKEVANALSGFFPGPLKLEFKSCYYPYLLINKKRHAGLLWTNPDKYERMDCVGIESFRWPNFRLAANLISSVLELLLKNEDEEQAIAVVKNVVSDLLQNRTDVSLLVLSKELRKAEYENKLPHVVLAGKLRRRDAGAAPAVGDLVPYVIIKGTKKQPFHSRAEDPRRVLEKNIPIDVGYYLKEIRKPLEQIFEPVMREMPGGVDSLFQGDHTRKVSSARPSKGGIMDFIKVGLSCLGCKASITSGALCVHCKPREAEYYTKNLENMTELEKNYSALWTECQRCSGNVCQDVLCSNGDCPIYYRRRKVRMDLRDASARLDRFEELEW